MDMFQEKLRERMTEQELNELLQGVRGADAEAAQAARRYVESLAAPPGSLGKLTDAAVQLAGITGRVKNTVDRRRIIVLCADNGVVEEGVSSTPPIVTLSQALNMTRHLTGMSILAAMWMSWMSGSRRPIRFPGIPVLKVQQKGMLIRIISAFPQKRSLDRERNLSDGRDLESFSAGFAVARATL